MMSPGERCAGHEHNRAGHCLLIVGRCAGLRQDNEPLTLPQLRPGDARCYTSPNHHVVRHRYLRQPEAERPCRPEQRAPPTGNESRASSRLYAVASHPPENRVEVCQASDAQSGRLRAIFITAGGLCPGVTVVESLFAPPVSSRLGKATNDNGMVRQGITRLGDIKMLDEGLATSCAGLNTRGSAL
jgi:hypothetical protein